MSFRDVLFLRLTPKPKPSDAMDKVRSTEHVQAMRCTKVYKGWPPLLWHLRQKHPAVLEVVQRKAWVWQGCIHKQAHTHTHAHIITHVCTGIMEAYSDKDTHDEFISSNNLVDVAFLCTAWACSDFPRGLLQVRAAMDELFKMIVMIKKSLEKQCANTILSTNVCSRAYTK